MAHFSLISGKKLDRPPGFFHTPRMYQLTGKVKLILDLQTFASGFSKREFVVTTTEDRYPQDIKLETVKEKTAMLDELSEGQEITASFDVRGNEYNGKYYVNLVCWKVEAGAGSASGGSGGGKKSSASKQSEPDYDSDGGSDEPSPSDFRKSDDDADDDIPF